jgi:DNA-binding LacI/PurR family transcriptional regulator
MGTEFLLEKGHRRIGFATVIEGLSFTEQAYEGYKQAMRLGGGVLSDQGVIRMDREVSLHGYRQAVLEQLERLIRDYRPTALVIDPFEETSAVLALIDRLGISIPEDLELVVQDLDTIGQSIPQRPLLHEVCQPLFEMGAEAVKQINQLIETGGPRITRMLNPRLEIKTFESSPSRPERPGEHMSQQTLSGKPLVGSV